MSRRILFGLLFALVLLDRGLPCAAAIPAPPLALPGGSVADPDGKVGFVPNTAGGIDALDLASGKLLWDTKEAPRPLLATADRLFAQAPIGGKANQVRFVVLDTTRKGKRLVESQPLSFPGWVSVSVAHGRSFGSTGRLDGDALLLIWQARSWYAGGAGRPRRQSNGNGGPPPG